MTYMTPGTSGTVGQNPHSTPPAPSKKMRGLGDLLHWVFQKIGIEVVVKKVTKGKDCGCAKRQEMLNNAVPFTKDETDVL